MLILISTQQRRRIHHTVKILIVIHVGDLTVELDSLLVMLCEVFDLVQTGNRVQRGELDPINFQHLLKILHERVFRIANKLSEPLFIY